MLAAPLLLAAALAPADAPTPPPDAAVSDAGELQGEWEVVSLVRSGRDQTADVRGFRWEFAGVSHVITCGNATTPPVTVRVNAACDPRRVDTENEPHKTTCGIFRRVGDTLQWADDVSGGGGRPSSFESAPGVAVWTLRRVKK